MADVAQILGVPSKAPPPLPASQQQPSRALQQQLQGRGLDAVSGQESRSAELPTAVVKTHLVKVGNKFINSQKPARKWTWAPFTSSSRTDGLVLRHWVRANVEYPDYPYARFDIHLDPISYSDDEYKAYLQSDTWTKSETDLLMDLVKRFELRWPVIHDRWMGTFEETSRKIEDLQHRYYSVAALLTQSRISQEAAVEAKALESPSAEPRRASDLLETAAARALASADPQHQPLLHNLGSGTSNKKAFDLKQERERRAQMEALWKRTKEEETKEASMRAELKQVEMRLRKLKKNGAHIAVTTAASTSKAGPNSRAVSPATNVVARAFSAGPTPVPGTPYLQSGRLVAPTGVNKTLLNRLETVLTELRVPNTPKDFLPTKQVCDLYDSVRRDAMTLLILQKHALQKEGLVQARRLKLAKMGGDVRVVDEETLMGITPARSKTSRKTSATGGKASKAGAATASAAAAKAGGKGAAATAAAKAAATKAANARAGGKGAAARAGGKAAPKTTTATPKTAQKSAAAGKGGAKKPAAKRKRKTDTPKSSPVPPEAVAATAVAQSEPKSAKKRARKSV